MHGPMTVRYEANPPKRSAGEAAMERFVRRAVDAADLCDAIHITENVLGYERATPLEAGRAVAAAAPGTRMTATMRTRDKDAAAIDGFAAACAGAGFSGLLVVNGDPPRDGSPDSGQVPSAVVSRLSSMASPALYLSAPASPDYARMGAKVRARPRGFFTQVIRDAGQVRSLAENLAGFEVIPTLLYPSEKNRRSAEFLGLDLDAYGPGFPALAEEALQMTGDVLVTSPADYEGVRGFLGTL